MSKTLSRFSGGMVTVNGTTAYPNPVSGVCAGTSIVVGPSMSNFAEIAGAFLDAGALVQVSDADAARRELLALFADPARCQRLGDAARGVLDRHRGAVERTMREIADVMQVRAGAFRSAEAGVTR